MKHFLIIPLLCSVCSLAKIISFALDILSPPEMCVKTICLCRCKMGFSIALWHCAPFLLEYHVSVCCYTWLLVWCLDRKSIIQRSLKTFSFVQEPTTSLAIGWVASSIPRSPLHQLVAEAHDTMYYQGKEKGRFNFTQEKNVQNFFCISYTDWVESLARHAMFVLEIISSNFNMVVVKTSQFLLQRRLFNHDSCSIS